MKFYDKVKISVKAGKGGDGLVTGRREAKVPYGGPAGGDGGKGGSIYIVCSKDENTLINYKYKKQYKSPDGGNGMSSEKNGANGDDIILKVPIGTLIKDNATDQVLYQFIEDGQKYMIVKGGRGGLGNIHFKTSIRQYPEFALLGEPGEALDVILELQLLGDISLIGTPSVGKSSIINSISNVKAKTAEYHFTTLVPNIGTIKYGESSFYVVDVPGLIHGASSGKGLGNQFLRHILKSKIFCFVLDLSRYEAGIDEFNDLFEEIKQYIKNRFIGSQEYGPQIQDIKFKIYEQSGNILFEVYAKFDDQELLILKKSITLILNKYDIIDDHEILQEYLGDLTMKISKSLKIKKDILINNISITSTYTGSGIDDLKKFFFDKISNFDSQDIIEFDRFDIHKQESNSIQEITEQEMPSLIDNGYIQEGISKHVKVWEIYDADIAYFVYVLPWGNDQAEMRFWETLSKKGLMNRLENAGILKGDILKIKSFYPGYQDRYIIWD